MKNHTVLTLSLSIMISTVSFYAYSNPKQPPDTKPVNIEITDKDLTIKTLEDTKLKRESLIALCSPKQNTKTLKVLHHTESCISFLMREIKKQNSEIKRITDEKDSIIVNLEKKVEVTQSEFPSLKKKLEDTTATLKEAKTQNKNLSDELNNTKAKYEYLVKENETVVQARNKYADELIKITDLSKEKIKREKENSERLQKEFNQNITSLNNNMDELKGKNESLIKSIDIHQKENGNLVKELESKHEQYIQETKKKELLIKKLSLTKAELAKYETGRESIILWSFSFTSLIVAILGVSFLIYYYKFNKFKKSGKMTRELKASNKHYLKHAVEMSYFYSGLSEFYKKFVLCLTIISTIVLILGFVILMIYTGTGGVIVEMFNNNSLMYKTFALVMGLVAVVFAGYSSIEEKRIKVAGLVKDIEHESANEEAIQPA